MFGRKKKKIKKETFMDIYNKKFTEAQKQHTNYVKLVKQLPIFVQKYKNCFHTDISFSGDAVTLYLKKEYYQTYPDEFVAFADKLGLNVEPQCGSYFSDDLIRGVNLRVKGA